MLTPKSFSMHVPVSKIYIVHSPNKIGWEGIQKRCQNVVGGEVEIFFTLRTNASPHTFKRKMTLANVEFGKMGDSDAVRFTVFQNGESLNGLVILKTGKGEIILI